MRSCYQDLPKAELHVHLEGSLEPETVCELCPELTADEVRARYHCSGFEGFLESFKFAAECLKRPEDYGLAARRLLSRLAAQNVRYAEVTLAAGVVLFRRQELTPVIEAVVHEGQGSAVEVRWVLDAVRHFGAGHVMEVARQVARHAGGDLVAFGIGGYEAEGPIEAFADALSLAREAGLHLTIHAGETAGPESVWGAVRLGAERIGHGIRSAEDPALLDYLRERRIPLEVCISSNVATRAVQGLHAHPVRRLYDAGVPIVLGTDDPAIFGTTLEHEYEIAAREFSFTDEELRGVIENGFRYAFACSTT